MYIYWTKINLSSLYYGNLIVAFIFILVYKSNIYKYPITIYYNSYKIVRGEFKLAFCHQRKFPTIQGNEKKKWSSYFLKKKYNYIVLICICILNILHLYFSFKHFKMSKNINFTLEFVLQIIQTIQIITVTTINV